MSNVTPEMIATALGVAAPTGLTEEQWKMWIADAEMLIEARRSALEVEQIDEAKLDYVVREAVVDHIKHPDDATQVTIAVDDASSSRTYRSGKGRVTIKDEWWPLLGLIEASGAFALDMIATGTIHLPWCSASLGASYCSCGADIAGTPIYEDPDW